MSCEDDVQVWEEVKIEEVILDIDTLKREDLIKIEESEKKHRHRSGAFFMQERKVRTGGECIALESK